MPKAYRGDIGNFRACLQSAGFHGLAENASIYNDDRKCKPKLPGRRLKLWSANQVYESSPNRQLVLEAALRNSFKDRIISMYFTKNIYGGKSLCIKLNS